MTGEKLLIALRRTVQSDVQSNREARLTVCVVDKGRFSAKVTSTQALYLIQTNECWHGSGSKRRISAIEFRPPQPKRRTCRWEFCWRTVDAAVMQPSIDWLHSRRSGCTGD